jgi:hypothetical protein
VQVQTPLPTPQWHTDWAEVNCHTFWNSTPCGGDWPASCHSSFIPQQVTPQYQLGPGASPCTAEGEDPLPSWQPKRRSPSPQSSHHSNYATWPYNYPLYLFILFTVFNMFQALNSELQGTAYLRQENLTHSLTHSLSHHTHTHTHTYICTTNTNQCFKFVKLYNFKLIYCMLLWNTTECLVLTIYLTLTGTGVKHLQAGIPFI